MLKGHAKIELKNEKTGKLDVIEHDNMITNALSSQLKALATSYGFSGINTEYLPLNNKGMGGIVLFQNMLDENVDNVGIPDEAVNPIIGYASNAISSGTDSKRGNRNLTESSKLANGYKFVYDFATNQANGEIAALGLTHTGAGENPTSSGILGNAIRNNITSATAKTIVNYGVDLDWNTGILTCIQTISTTTLKVSKYRINIGIIPINVILKLYKSDLLSEETITLSGTIRSDTVWVNNEDDSYYYGFYKEDTSTSYVYTGKLVRINKNNYSLDTSYSGSIQAIKDLQTKPSVIMDGYLYCGTNPIVKVNLQDTTDSKYIETTGLSTRSLVAHNGIIHAGNSFIKKDLSIITGRKSGEYAANFLGTSVENQEKVFVRNDGIAIFFSYHDYYSAYYVYAGNLRDYLATINNLDSPVIKTSEQSMKITYTITEE